MYTYFIGVLNLKINKFARIEIHILYTSYVYMSCKQVHVYIESRSKRVVLVRILYCVSICTREVVVTIVRNYSK